jgi:hypothetical protein
MLLGIVQLSGFFSECTNIETIKKACNVQIEEFEKKHFCENGNVFNRTDLIRNCEPKFLLANEKKIGSTTNGTLGILEFRCYRAQ